METQTQLFPGLKVSFCYVLHGRTKSYGVLNTAVSTRYRTISHNLTGEAVIVVATVTSRSTLIRRALISTNKRKIPSDHGDGSRTSNQL